MHELSLARGLLAAVERNIAPSDRVVRVRLSAGAAAAVVPSSLRFAFQVLAEGTHAEGAEILVRIIPALSRCEDCRETFEFEGMIASCPRCGRLGGELISGEELTLESIEVADV